MTPSRLICRRSVRGSCLILALITFIGLSAGAAAPPAIADAATAHPGQAGAVMHQERFATSVRVSTSVRIYLIAIGDNGKAGPRIGCGDSLIAVTRPIPPTQAPLSAALRVLLNNHHAHYGQSGLYNALYQSTLHLQKATVTKGKAVVHLTGRLNLRGVCDDPRARAQLRRTVRQFPTVRSVAIYVNNVPLWKVLSER